MKTTSRFISVLLGAVVVSSASGGAVENVIDNPAPLVFYEFNAGGVTTYFTDCKGMGSQNEVEQRVSPRGEFIPSKIPGRLSVKNLTCSKGLTKSMDFWTWRQQFVNGRSGRSRVDATLIAYDQAMTPIAEWSFGGVWPASIDFNETTPGKETIVFAADQVQRLR
ncbi:phage tail protein [Methylomonas sp. MO1]|uniref:phage tail protein n=1 Tax=unclassified Methylomonas TaxID=2608980 RepID=UPI00047D5FF0|nr:MULTISPECIES: phage tail protein [unclassified Methylomonas]MDT4288637.1 phage tail protein [Methylomonas sp. MO1]